MMSGKHLRSDIVLRRSAAAMILGLVLVLWGCLRFWAFPPVGLAVPVGLALMQWGRPRLRRELTRRYGRRPERRPRRLQRAA